MIYWLTREDFDHPPLRLCNNLADEFCEISPLSYESVFYKKIIPAGHYIFSDFDRMSSYEEECAIALTDAIRKSSPDSLILNDPRCVLERVSLLEKLHRLGLNKFSVTRIDAENRPNKYPVFIRSEDDCRGPDTGLLHSLAELDLALEKLSQQGKTLKRRVAVEFCAQTDEDGWYRKYGVFNIGGSIIPQHIQRNKDWNVKSNGAQYDEVFAEEELEFILNIPHQEQLRHIFHLASIDFGRIDYTLVDDQIQTFEINTNPTFPKLKGEKDNRQDGRSKRRLHIRKKVLDALKSINTIQIPGQLIHFRLPEPLLERPRIPRKSNFYNRIKWALNHR